MALAKCVCWLLPHPLAMLSVEYQIVFAFPSRADKLDVSDLLWCWIIESFPKC